MTKPEPMSNEAIKALADQHITKGTIDGDRLFYTRPFARAVEAARDAAWQAYADALVAQAVRDFAKYLHSLPNEDGWEVGPVRIKHTASGQIESGPWWVTQDDTDRWALAFLARTRGGGSHG